MFSCLLRLVAVAVLGCSTLSSHSLFSFNWATDTNDCDSFAKAELYIGLAQMFRQFDFELYDTIRERDIDHVWAHIAGEPDKRGKGLRFKVTEAF